MRICFPKGVVFRSIYVVFEDNTTLSYLKLLKRGFRHCYVLLNIEGTNNWLELNPASNQLIFNYIEFPDDYDYIYALGKKDMVSICEVPINLPIYKPAPLWFFTCVEFAKRSLGLHKAYIFTPYQLYKYLKRKGAK
ncbi:MAG: hypothetical protein LBL47_01050 [Lactobacillus sp.]|jgi:hypothetical protein|nr:hypothetical protein [Lactobacillus sp.]